MIKTKFFLFVATTALASGVLLAKTEVMPPSGPFKSQLRATYSILNVNSTTIPKIKNSNKKTYTFGVPDLGRYQERSPTDQSFNDVFSQQVAPTFDRSNQANLDDMSFQDHRQMNPYADPAQQRQSIDSKPASIGFDDMEVGTTSTDDANLYPPEWAQPNPLRPKFDRQVPMQQQQRQGMNNGFNQNSFNQPNQNRMGMPFPNQMLPFNSNNKNNGYN